MRILKKALPALLKAIPAALWTAVFLLRAFYRQPLQALIVSAGLLTGYGLIFYFLINPRVRAAFSRLSRRNVGGLLLWELIVGISLVYLVPFHTPIPEYTRLTISPAAEGRIELLEIRIGESVLPLNSALTDGNCQIEAGRVIANDQTCRIIFEIPRPEIAPTPIKLLFSNGPDFVTADYSLELTQNTVNLTETEIGEATIVVPSPVPSKTVDLVFFLISALLAAQILFLAGLCLTPSYPEPAESGNSFSGLLFSVWTKYKAYFLPALAIYALLPAVVAINFPMELELRESTKWLHALALGAGVNIYDNSKTAFINMSHGPMDALIKSFLLWIKTPTFILRWTVLVFPLAAFLSAWWIIKNEPRKLLEHAVLSAIVLELTLITYNQVIITGQTETSAALFLVLTMLFMEKAVTGSKVTWLYALLAGMALMCCFLSNWRYGPTLASVGILYIVRLAISSNSRKQNAAAFSLTVAGGLLIFAGLLGKYFDFNLPIYFNHFFGFYKDFGERLFFDEFLSTQITSTTGLILFIIIGLVFMIRLSPRKDDKIELTSWMAGLTLIYITTAFAFYLNGAGGGIHYYYPLIIFVWFLFLRYHSRIPSHSLLPLASVAALFVSGAGFSPVLPLLTMKDSWQRAADTMKFLKETNKVTPIWTEDMHLFKDAYSGETIDMGDYDSFYRKSGLFPQDFNMLVDAHFAEMRANPPEVVTISQASSPELQKFVDENQYINIAGYYGWIDTKFDILVRPDSSIQAPPEIR